VQEAEAALEEAQVRLVTAQQELANLGLVLELDKVEELSPAAVGTRLRFLGLPESLTASLDSRTPSNLLAVTAPFDGVITSRTAVVGERVAAGATLFTLVDPRHLWLTLQARPEDAALLRPGLRVTFHHDDDPRDDEGEISWISPAIDERTRTVAVRVELENRDGRHRARTFGTARIMARAEPFAIVVPSAAVHWEGDCHVVFVRDKNYDVPGGPKVFHVRKVRPGAKDGPWTEIIAGVWPGELVATTASGILRAELLKNNLGEGCGCHH
jgi:cobalt-zinc-cadmium efflux system membrane fusion protein